MTPLAISDVRLTSAHAGAADGLLGFLTFTMDDRLRLDGVTLRRTRDGRLTLSFPERRDAAGRSHPIVRPLDDGSRQAIESAVFAALGMARDARP